jgi:hypothetical protein
MIKRIAPEHAHEPTDVEVNDHNDILFDHPYRQYFEQVFSTRHNSISLFSLD